MLPEELVESPGRVIIEGVQPEIDGGRFPIKRAVGESVQVEADIFTDGHDILSALLLYRKETDGAWKGFFMKPLVNDRWRASFRVDEIGRYFYTFQGWVDRFMTWRRIRTLQVLRDVGLLWMNCVEPVGPEHSAEEIVDLMFLARQYGAVYSGVMRRINFPGSPMEKFGMITELEMARMVAVSRLVMGDVPRAHCTHEPNSAALMAGANLFFPEVGSSPRDGNPDTGKGRGRTLEDCNRLFQEMNWNPHLPSNCYTEQKE